MNIYFKAKRSFEQTLSPAYQSQRNCFCSHQKLLIGALENRSYRASNKLMPLVLHPYNTVNGSIIMTMNCEKCCLFMSMSLAVARAINIYSL
jgi:hypothetical protein